VVKKVYLKGIL